MTASLRSWLSRVAGRHWKPLNFSSQADRFLRIPKEQKIEEECLPGYVASRYYPVRLGEVLRNQYQIVGKLGFGASSTVWLARDLNHLRHVALKVFVNAESMGSHLDNELHMYQRMAKVTDDHPGRSAVRELLDSFDILGPDGKHRCLVHRPLWESMLTFMHRNPEGKLPPEVVAFTLRRLFEALDFLHTKCQIIHTDIKADNIMFGIEDDSVFNAFEQAELETPSPRKEIDDGSGRTIYTCRELRTPKQYGAPVLCDFGSAVPGGREHTEDCQPNIYRAPEVILEAPWSYQIDIWNAGCMVWDLFQGYHLFTGLDPEHQTYRSRAHLSEIIALLGPPPADLLSKGALMSRFFTEEGDFAGGIVVPDPISLRDIELRLNNKPGSKELFLKMMDSMLQWDPAKRSSAADLAESDWVKHET